MPSFIHITAMGNSTKDAEVVTLNTGTLKSKFSIAVETYDGKDDKGEYKYSPRFYEVVAFGKLAERIQKTVGKGTGVYVEGSLNYREYKSGAETKRAYEIEASQVLAISRAKNSTEVQSIHSQEKTAQNENLASITAPFAPEAQVPQEFRDKVESICEQLPF